MLKQNSKLDLERAKDIACLLISTFLGCAALALIYLFATLIFPQAQPEPNDYFILPEYFKPEPIERFTYLLGLILALPFSVYIYWICKNKLQFRFLNLHVVEPGHRRLLLFESLAFFCLIALLLLGLREANGFYFRSLIPMDINSAVTGIGLLLVVAGCAFPSVSRWIVWPLFWFIVFMTAILRFFSEADPATVSSHFEVVVFAMAQVARGKIILNDLSHQYGFYPHFIAPLFWLGVPLSVTSITMIFAVLTAVSYGFLLSAIRAIVKQPWIQVGLLIVIIYHSGLWNHTWLLEYKLNDYLDPYFQYVPIRLLFPCVSLWLITRRSFAENRTRIFTEGFLLSLGLLWNLDSGLAAIGTWGLCLLLKSKHDWRAKAEAILISIICLACACMVYGLYLRLLWGEFPNFLNFGKSQILFYGLGFYMMPLSFPGLWMFVVVILFLGLLFGFQDIFRDFETKKAINIFGVSALGLLCFSYFQGRSHAFVLPTVMYTFWILVGWWLDQTVAMRVGRSWVTFASGVVISFFLSLIVLKAGSLLPLYARVVLDRVSDTMSSSDKTHPRIEFVRRNVLPESNIGLISFQAGSLLLAGSGKSNLPQSLYEPFTKAQMEEYFKRFEADQHARIIVDTRPSQSADLAPLAEYLGRKITGGFILSSKSEDNTLLLFTPKSR